MQLHFAFEGEWASASSYWASDRDGCTCYLQSVYRGVIESSDVYQAKRNSLFLPSCPFSIDETTAGVITEWVCKVWNLSDWHLDTLQWAHCQAGHHAAAALSTATQFALCNPHKAAPGHEGTLLSRRWDLGWVLCRACLKNAAIGQLPELPCLRLLLHFHFTRFLSAVTGTLYIRHFQIKTDGE